jgi:Flp pilus assembly protein TadG
MSVHARAVARAGHAWARELEKRMVPIPMGPPTGDETDDAAADAGIRRRARTRGQAVVEFALVAPVLIAIALGVVDFGRVYAAAVTVESAAREAADYGSWHLYETGWQSEATRRACAAASVIDGYVGAADGTSCTNPTVIMFSNETTASGVPLVRAQLTYDFRTTVQMPFMPHELVLVRDSRFAQH